MELDYGFSYNKTEAQFRVPIAIQIAFAILTFVGIAFLPESPRWVSCHFVRRSNSKLTIQ